MDWKEFFNKLLQLETVQDIEAFIMTFRDIIINEIAKLVPVKIPNVFVLTILGYSFDIGMSELRKFETKDALIIKINFYLTQLHGIAVNIIHVINGNDNEIIQGLADNILAKLTPLT